MKLTLKSKPTTNADEKDTWREKLCTVLAFNDLVVKQI